MALSTSPAPKIRFDAAVKSVASGNDAFTVDLYNALKNDNDNMVLSGFSVGSVVSMAYAGANSKTKTEIRKALKLPASDDDLYNGYSDITAVTRSNENFTLENANAIFVHHEFKILEPFVSVTEGKFRSSTKPVNFGESESARKSINDWVEDKTHSKIKDLLEQGSITPLTRLVLVNAVYFKGDWAKKFDKANTEDKDFFVSQTSTKQVPTMHASDIEFGITKVNELAATALELPYKGDRVSMIILLPDQKFGLDDVERKLADFDLAELDFRRKSKIDLSIPKFKLESSHDLVPALKTLGLSTMFQDGEADFTGIGGNKGDLSVSSVVQKAVIEVNEEGSEAAAATGMVMMMRSMPLPPTPVNVDHPFMFIIRDKLTGMVLFAGRVTDPSV